MDREKGFSLIELLIVVAIILIILAIAIPNLMRSKMAANQAAAATNLRTIVSSQTTFASTYPASGYASGLAQLGPGAAICPGATAANACLIDFTLGCAAGTSGVFCQKSNYRYAITGIGIAPPPFTDYVAFATPAARNLGQQDFCSFNDGAVRVGASANPPPSPIINTSAACSALAPL